MNILPDISGTSTNGELVSLFELVVPERYALVWWHPQVLTAAACRTCSGAGEPVKLLRQIHEAGCEIVGLSYESPESITRYQKGIGIIYPAMSVDADAAFEHGVSKLDGEPWPSIPHRVAFLIDDSGVIINRYEVHDPTVFLRTVLTDVKAGPPPSKWETPKRKKFLGIF